MTEALFTAEGATCLSLGVQTPVAETIKCAEAERVDIVALSCTAAGVTREAQRALGELQQRLDPSIEIWLGGAGAPLIARSHPRIVLVSSLEEGLEKLSVWQARKS
jgi:cobalamin-dependent methionine synthase I